MSDLKKRMDDLAKDRGNSPEADIAYQAARIAWQASEANWRKIEQGQPIPEEAKPEPKPKKKKKPEAGPSASSGEE